MLNYVKIARPSLPARKKGSITYYVNERGISSSGFPHFSTTVARVFAELGQTKNT